MVKALGFLAVTAAVAGAGWWWTTSEASSSTVFREAAVARDTLTVSLSATGTLEPEEVVDVGAQVAGIIREFGRDAATGKEVDYGSVVEPETILARIDDSLFKEEVQLAKAELAQMMAKLRQAELAVEQGESNIARAEADLALTQSKFRQAERDWGRAEKLKTSKTISLQEAETTQSLFEQAQASVTIADAALAQARSTLESTRAAVPDAQAAVDRASAVLRKAEANFGYTTIRSPIHGVVVDRRVNIGQTVVSSLNAPSLFLIAKDLQKLEIWASVNEADIGQIREGQKVKFSVDAHPEDKFHGVVSQIRLNATMTQNVVTYTVVVTVDNHDGRLIPYLTANLEFEVSKKADVLLVPNAALRWQPRADQIHPDDREAAVAALNDRKPESRSGGGRPEDASGGGRPPRAEGAPPAEGAGGSGSRREGKPRRAASGPRQGTVWVAEGDYVRPVTVKVGATDTARTEVTGENVSEGMPVVIGESKKIVANDKTINPFQPNFFGRRRGGS